MHASCQTLRDRRTGRPAKVSGRPPKVDGRRRRQLLPAQWHNRRMPSSRPPCFVPIALALLLPAAPGFAATNTTAADGNAAAVLAARAFVAAATQQYGDAVDITVDPPAAGSRLPPCFRHEVFLPPGSKLWGKTRVGVRCNAPASWTAFLAVRVSVSGHYLVTARKINRGQTLTAGDLEIRRGDLAALPPSTLTDRQLAIGRRAKLGLVPQQALRREHLLQTPVIRQGDRVRIVARGEGFAAFSEGVALNHAAEGEVVKVRNGGGKTLSGIARAAGEVEVTP